MRQSPLSGYRLIGVYLPWEEGYCRDLRAGILRFARPQLPWGFYALESANRVNEGGPPEVRPNPISAVIGVFTPEQEAKVASWGLPTINASPFCEGPPPPGVRRVVTHHDAIAALAGGHLRQRGILQVRITAPPERASHVERYAAALQACGLRVIERDGDPPWAVLCLDHRWGRICCENYRRDGILVPTQALVLAIGEDELRSLQCFPPLSTVALPAEPLGYQLAACLQDWLAGRETPMPSLGPTRVVERASTDTLVVDDPQLCRALAYIREHATEHLSTTAVAAHAGLTRRALERACRATLGRSPYQLVTDRRCVVAQQLLIDGDAAIESIAQRCGFANAARLAAAFRARFGVSPGRFRVLHQTPASRAAAGERR